MKWLLPLLLFLPFSLQAQNAIQIPDWFSESLLDLREDVADAAKEGKRLMLYFGQDGCPYCKQLMEVNFRERAIVDRTRRHFVALALNIWGDREVTWTDGKKLSEKQLARELKVQFTPTLLFLDEKGGVALRLNGYLPPERFLAALDQAARSQKQPPPPSAQGKPGPKPLAMLVVAPKCDACDELERNLERPEVKAQLKHFQVERVSSENPAGYVPSLVLFDTRGREVLRTEAYLRPFHLAGALEYVASGAYRREPSFQRFLQAKAERMRSRGETVDLWN